MCTYIPVYLSTLQCTGIAYICTVYYASLMPEHELKCLVEKQFLFHENLHCRFLALLLAAVVLQEMIPVTEMQLAFIKPTL